MRGDTSLMLKALGSRVKTWQERPDGVLLFPAEASFNEVLTRTYRSFSTLLERMLELTALVVIVPGEAMTEETTMLYRLLKRMECHLSWRGMARPVPRFTGLQRPEKWKQYLPKVKKDERLLKALNSNSAVLDSIRRLKPAELTVVLQSLDSSLLRGGNPEQVLEAMAEFYHEPTTVTWALSLRSALPQLSNTKATITRCYDILDLTGRAVREVSEASRREVPHHATTG